MSKQKRTEIFYTDEYGNKICINTIVGFSALMHNVFANCETKKQCEFISANIDGIVRRAKENRIAEISE